MTKVLNCGFVELEEHMGDDRAVVRAARICYQSEAHTDGSVYSCGCSFEAPFQVPDLNTGQPSRVCPSGHPGRLVRGITPSDYKLIQRLVIAEPAHNTVFEHSVFRFHVKAPIFVARQWMRHRVGTFNEMSLRFVKLDPEEAPEFYIPDDAVAGDPSVYDKAVRQPLGYIDSYIEHQMSSFETYQFLLDRGWPAEKARCVLPLGAYTKFIWTVNAWSLMNWLRKRLDKGAQKEHQAYAFAIFKLWYAVMPLTAREFGKTVKVP